MAAGVVHSINVSNGGVPKLPREACFVGVGGLEGDRQRDLRYHGGPGRAVCLYSLELITALQAEGHSIAPGSIGENLTVGGVDWAQMTPGARVEIGPVVLELTDYAPPCNNIARSFQRRQYVRVNQKVNAGWSRLYARVLVEGTVRVGDSLKIAA
ncbi:MAG TPA: MOSC domain-containing protein [Burkholderiales bacterium]|nr:MOSC domain-containing protein [Burkholderiales bacterium]